MGQPLVLQPGDLCYYWRDTPAGSTAKLKWRGPATVIMREQDQHGHHTDIYWIVHRTVLLHAAPEHVKAATPAAVQDFTERLRDPLDTTKQSLSNIRGRDVTQYIDLPKSNKRRRDKVATDEERRDEVATDEEEDEHDEDMQQFPGQELPPDRWNVSEDGRLWLESTTFQDASFMYPSQQQMSGPTPFNQNEQQMFAEDIQTLSTSGSEISGECPTLTGNFTMFGQRPPVRQ